MKYIKVNLNDSISFAPSVYGRDYYRKRMESILKGRSAGFSLELKTDASGRCKMQLWDFINVFGDAFRLGHETPCDPRVFIQAEYPVIYLSEGCE